MPNPGSPTNGNFIIKVALYSSADSSPPTLTLLVPVEKAGRYALQGGFTKAVDYGIAKITVDNFPARDPIDFYFDFSSPYSYIASEWVAALAARHGRTVNWKAILLGVTFQAAELKSPVSYPIKRDYAMRDFERSARFEGVRLKGNDFFASLTFPFGDSFCTWVTGGWGGDIVGLSSLDGWDASDNETRTYFNFENGRWYALRLQVTPDRIMAWIDERRIINVEIRGRSIGLRHGETKLSAPFGFASYATTGGLRKIEYRLTARSSTR